MVIRSAMKILNSEIIEIKKKEDFQLRPIVSRLKSSTRKLSQLINILLKPFLKRIKIFIRNSLDFLNKCPRDVDENTETVTPGVISLYTSIPQDFGLEAIGYFLAKDQEYYHPRYLEGNLS